MPRRRIALSPESEMTDRIAQQSPWRGCRRAAQCANLAGPSFRPSALGGPSCRRFSPPHEERRRSPRTWAAPTSCRVTRRSAPTISIALASISPDAVARHRLTYLGPDHRLDLRHRRAGLGQVVFNALQFGGNVRVDAPDFPDYYLLQFMLEGGRRVRQAGHCYDMRAGSIAVINPRQPFEKSWSPSGRQLMLRIERRLLDRELIAWTGREPRGPIEFDQSRTFAFAETGTLTRVVRMLCDDLRGGSSALDHPLIRDRFASTLASALLIGLPHNHIRAIEAAEKPIAPASVRRAERFIEENATNAVELTDVARATGVSARALQQAFRRFRDTTPMAQLRALRLEIGRIGAYRVLRDSCKPQFCNHAGNSARKSRRSGD